MDFQKLAVSKDRHHLINEDSSPFFYLADTGWRLVHALSREDADMYLGKRAEQGFNAVQVMVLDEFDGVRKPNYYGRVPFQKNESGEYDPSLPDDEGEYSYWAHVDYCVKKAEELGLYLALLPTWGDKFNLLGGYGPEFFYKDNAFVYGSFLADRYKDSPNIIWVMGGDRPMTRARHFDVVRAMAEGILSKDKNHLFTFHPRGGQSSTESVGNEDWLDFNMIQSGHSRKRYNYEMILRDYAVNPPKPVLDGEPGYEHHPEDFDPANGYLDEVDCRQEFFWSVLSGACGHTYGDHSVWGMWDLPVKNVNFIDRRGHFCIHWRKALDANGAKQIHIWRDIVLSRDYLSSRPAPEVILEQMKGVNFVPVLLGKNYLMAYTAQGIAVEFKKGALPFTSVSAKWISPRDGACVEIGSFAIDDLPAFTPPAGGRGQDWVLILDAVEGE